MRKEPSEDSKVVSQALFGEVINVEKEWGDWALIQTPDSYSGWVQRRSFILKEKPLSHDLEVGRLQAHVYAQPDTEYAPILTLPFGSKLEKLEDRDSRWVQILLPNALPAFIQKGDVEIEPFDLLFFSKKFLGLPYTWGGRSSFGFDCSGYVQMLYLRLGVKLPRDAHQQAVHGTPIPIEKLTLGDLIFWGKSDKEIKHVGMSLGKEEFIHTSVRENRPYLRISKITDREWSGKIEAFYPFRIAKRFL